MKPPKRKIMTTFERLPRAIQLELKKAYPDGFQAHLICMTDHKSRAIHVLPYETPDSSYLIKMENHRAEIINFLGNHKDFEENTNQHL